MNFNQTRQIRTAALASAIGVVMIVVASPATAAQHQRTDRGPEGVSETAALGFGMPMAALDGQTLAQYLQEHQAQDERTFAGV